MKKDKIFIAIPVIIIIALLAVIGFQLAKSQFDSSENTRESGGPARSTGDGGQGRGGESKGPAPGGGEVTPPPSQ